MKSDKIILDGHKADPTPALAEVERCAAYCGLNQKQTLQLRLLAEELLGLTRAILGECRSTFWVEGENQKMRLVATAYAQVSDDKRAQLVGMATSGQNQATRGVMGKIRRFIEIGLYGDNDPENQRIVNALVGGYGTGIHSSMGAAWSLVQYMDGVKAQGEKRAEEWDELEKSIVAKLADDVTVSVNNREATITIVKQF